MKYISGAILVSVFSGCAQTQHAIQKENSQNTKTQNTKKQLLHPYVDQKGLYCPYDEKTIEVTLRENATGEFIACEEYTIKENGPLSAGRPTTHPTTTGNFKVQWKAKSWDSKKYPSTDGTNNMNNALFFSNIGEALHSGNIMQNSHGCVRLEKYNAEWLYDWSPIGTNVIIRGDV